MSTSARSDQVQLHDDQCWQAVQDKNRSLADQFVYAVKTTGIFCRCDCAARLPLKKNVEFFRDAVEAITAGYRPCRRCQPEQLGLSKRHADKVAEACRLLEATEKTCSLSDLAESVGLSLHYFHRLFKTYTGVTPKAYAAAHRTDRLRQRLEEPRSVTQAIYGAGFSSSGRFYERSSTALGMDPKQFQKGGSGVMIRFAIGECWLGSILVAASEKGICAILIGDEPEPLLEDLQRRFHQADLVGGDADFEAHVAQVVGYVNDPAIGLDLPLDIRGTAFQRRVWEALTQIPLGETTTYSEVAIRIGQPKSVRAVAGACAANALAIVIPCHRVIRTDGSLSGYRWGVERKANILRREKESL